MRNAVAPFTAQTRVARVINGIEIVCYRPIQYLVLAEKRC